MAANDKETINCPIGRWYFKRMTLLGLLLLGFAGWFVYDAKVGYPKSGFEAVAYEAFKAGGEGESWEAYSSDAKKHFAKIDLDDEQLEAVKMAHDEGGKKMTWRDFAIKKQFDDTSAPPEGAENSDLHKAFTAGGVDGAKWMDYASANGLPPDPSKMANPDERVFGLYNAFEDASKRRDWEVYGADKGLPSKEPHFHGKGDILEQFVIGGLCGVAGLSVLVLMLLNRNREVLADSEAYYPKPTVKVPFGGIFKIDTRKWRRKGLAYVYYRSDGGAEKKAVVDDLKFVGAQQILDRMVRNFEGELIEEIVHEDGGEGDVPEAVENPMATDEGAENVKSNED